MQTTRVEDLWVYVDPFSEPPWGNRRILSGPNLIIYNSFSLSFYISSFLWLVLLRTLSSYACFTGGILSGPNLIIHNSFLPFYISSFLWLVLLRTLSSYVCTSILKGQSPIGLVLLSFRFLVLYWLLRGPTPSSHYPACIKEYPSPYCLQGIIILHDYLIICALSYQEQT